ncbi:MAG: formimidoylglutamase [Phycisphaeraceae bacterium]|nr:formimidoylglutamase [Phycisphaeraceae bacterium]
MIPHCRPSVWPSHVSDSRAASRFRTQDADGCRVAIIGLADDEGVRLNGGRPGARDGPGALRSALARYGAADAASGQWPAVFDAGDVEPGESIEDTHRRVREATDALLERGLFPIAIGGGHDLTLPFVSAVARKHGSLDGVYFDPHLDVRETPGSGMAFRGLLEAGSARSVQIRGFNPLVNSREHREWFVAHGGSIGALDAVWPSGDLFVSLDLDVLDQAFAPGVSATNPCGWTAQQAEALVVAAAGLERLRCFDIMELNPSFDEGGRTARLASHLLLRFLAEIARRLA